MESFLEDFRKSSELFIYIDDSGNSNFTNKGTEYLVVAGIATSKPEVSGSIIQALKYKFLRDGFDLTHFHASEDKQFVRDAFFATLRSCNNIDLYVVYGNKRITGVNSSNDPKLLTFLVEQLIGEVVKGSIKHEHEKVIVVIDKFLTRAQQDAMLKVLKRTIRISGKEFYIYFQSIKYDFNGQIADYVAWSKFISLEREEFRPWKFLEKCFDVESIDYFA